MRTIYFIRPTGAQPSGPWSTLIRFGVGIMAAAALLIMMLVGLVVVLPVMLIGGIGFYVFLRRKLRQAQQQRQAEDGIIDAEYTIVERRD
ncbi:hypothetical protein [Microvirga sp. P5_D2]